MVRWMTAILRQMRLPRFKRLHGMTSVKGQIFHFRKARRAVNLVCFTPTQDTQILDATAVVTDRRYRLHALTQT